jgi:hypothetical protein
VASATSRQLFSLAFGLAVRENTRWPVLLLWSYVMKMFRCLSVVCVLLMGEALGCSILPSAAQVSAAPLVKAIFEAFATKKEAQDEATILTGKGYATSVFADDGVWWVYAVK